MGVTVAGGRSNGYRFFANLDADVSGPATSWSSNVGVNKTW